ncbi:hypothetical protein K3495_g8354, partial [Podosphaera aphanis]
MWTTEFTVSCGVTPNETFPADLTLGHTMFHALGIKCLKNGSIQLLQMPHTPILFPLSSEYPSSNEISFVTSTQSVKWHPKTLPIGLKYGAYYATKYPSLFNKNLRRLDIISQTTHKIDTENHAPIKLPPRRYSPAQLQSIREFCNTHEGSLIQKSKSPWASPLLLTPKKTVVDTGKIVWRICVDYRQLNKVTKKHAHPLPYAYDEIQRAAGHKYYAFLDLENGFWQIRMNEADREKSAFVTPFGVYEWMVMPFGLCNAPATFQCFMEEILEPFRSFVAGLLDDICVWGDTEKELHSRLELIFERFVHYGLLLNSTKCRLFVQQGIFLGFCVSENGITADPEKVSAIRDRPMPSTTSEIRSFVNAAGYLRSLIKNFSKLAEPLINQTVGPKKSPVILTNESIKSWNKIKDAITSVPVVRKFDWRRPIILETDSSQTFVGAALLQPYLHHPKEKPISILHPIAYFSRKLTPTQQRYSSQERELLSILLSLQHWRHWVEGGDVTVITDHESLKTIQTKVEQPARMVRFLDSIEHYGVRILYRQGKANVLADYLSRPPEKNFNSEEIEHPENENTNVNSNSFSHPNITQPNLTSDEKNNVIKYPDLLNRIDLQCIFEYLTLKQPLPNKLTPDWVLLNFTVYNDKLHLIRHNAPYSPGKPPSTSGIATLLEVLEYDDLLISSTKIHENLGHASAGTTMRETGRRYWHPELKLAVYEAIRKCQSCQLMKPPDPTLGDLTPIQPAPPLTRWAIDHT